jgi:hypothetical protein
VFRNLFVAYIFLEKGFELTFKTADDSSLALVKYGEFLYVEAEITVTKVFITANMKNSKSHCKQEVVVR